MFNIFNKKPKSGAEVTLKISGMHCTSCALTIDDTLEEIDGVIESRTNYAKSETALVINPDKVDMNEVKEKITDLGYVI
jgi:P-type Cu+ transporter